MRFLGFIAAFATASQLLAGPSRFVINDDDYSEKVTRAGEKLLHQHKLVSVDDLANEVQTGGVNNRRSSPISFAPASELKLQPPDLYERLRESTMTVGVFYHCSDCGGWHFNGSSGFVVNENGVVCTCCHVLLDQDETSKESYLLAADAAGRVYPVLSVITADVDADTCFLRIAGTALKPLPLRTGIRVGETVYCLSHPGGYYFMFSQGLVARVAEKSSITGSTAEGKNSRTSRPILMLNITAEFAPGSSGAPVVDACGNVVGQVESIAEAGEPADDDPKLPASPSVPIRFCTAVEEILRLGNSDFVQKPHSATPKPATRSKHKKP